ncbi:hypothetical protein LCGC14_1632810 [marine sediment metagenome]|uniref:Uncharacterized protein n=1 Tax=marine sediment metagenome TaxID=412755 RepID=A0A0F9KHR8_9ZZZZ
MTIPTQDVLARDARIAYFRSLPGMIEEKAQEQARADRSDPFTYARVKAHFNAGVVVEPGDYSVEWGREIRTATFGDRRIEFSVQVPRNVKRL